MVNEFINFVFTSNTPLYLLWCIAVLDTYFSSIGLNLPLRTFLTCLGNSFVIGCFLPSLLIAITLAEAIDMQDKYSVAHQYITIFQITTLQTLIKNPNERWRITNPNKRWSVELQTLIRKVERSITAWREAKDQIGIWIAPNSSKRRVMFLYNIYF